MSKVVKIADAIYEEAIEEKNKKGNLSYMDTSSWISFLVEKGLVVVKEKEK